jgi:hypothetical protein
VPQHLVSTGVIAISGSQRVLTGTPFAWFAGHDISGDLARHGVGKSAFISALDGLWLNDFSVKM